ncbi:hypothetical protein FisN_8Lh381 [Fistulifera solaris]|uniref:Light-harvesting complex I chlorophyll a/b binding protein 4 n=1 Tax=Fistulifera solaris TaxID=1519565 RepID=A0A1Z5JN36_FISSO|nr:hypothetical protein FisN_8Lh381 [Fistulifera solaris]|eukprot:GAX15326.1 hypothetical protein FisN_8Lh381 [Fistulifera solaris]
MLGSLLIVASTSTVRVHAFSTNNRPRVALPSSNTLEECPFAGNIGFDPLHLATSRRALWHYRESEIKHARLAMIASLLLLIVEQDVSPWWYDSFEFDASLVGDAETLLKRIKPVWWGACAGLMALCELQTHERDEIASQSHYGNYAPGHLGWDPLHLYPDKNNLLIQQMYLSSEIWSGRVAMLGMVAPLSQQGYEWLSE